MTDRFKIVALSASVGLAVVAWVWVARARVDRQPQALVSPPEAIRIFNDHETRIRCYYTERNMTCYQMPEIKEAEPQDSPQPSPRKDVYTYSKECGCASR